MVGSRGGCSDGTTVGMGPSPGLPRATIAPVQDVLGLGSEARMNTPGVAHGNWGWRYEHGALESALAGRLRAITLATGRLHDD